MRKKKEKKKGGCLGRIIKWFIILCILSAFIVVVFPTDSTKNKSAATRTPSTKSAATSKPTEVPTEQPTAVPDVDLTAMSFTDALKHICEANTAKQSITVTNYGITDINGFHGATVTINIDTVLTEKHSVDVACRYMLAVAKEIYTTHPETDNITFEFTIDMVDKYGNTTNERAIMAAFDKELAENINFDYWDKHVYTTTKDFIALCKDVYIHKAIEKGFK